MLQNIGGENNTVQVLTTSSVPRTQFASGSPTINTASVADNPRQFDGELGDCETLRPIGSAERPGVTHRLTEPRDADDQQ